MGEIKHADGGGGRGAAGRQGGTGNAGRGLTPGEDKAHGSNMAGANGEANGEHLWDKPEPQLRMMLRKRGTAAGNNSGESAQ
mmetsp:Transcript_21962/g.41130  ORF Transcript_21962/g.41130 Transcript_21962/m.41130 type:complete len:82 (+) Transcript_21962:481-726(+)